MAEMVEVTTDPKQTIEELRPIVEAAAPEVAVLTGFVRAVVAVWRDIDRRERLPGGYSANVLDEATELRRAERRAWMEYRDTADVDGDPLDAFVARFAPLLTAYEELEWRLALAEAQANVRRLAMTRGWSEGQLQWALDPDHEVADAEMVTTLAAWRRATESASSPSIGVSDPGDQP